jgi:uncharacterized protein
VLRPVRPKSTQLRRWLRWTLRAGVGGFVAINACAFMMAWSMTHYDVPTARTTRLAEVSGWEKTMMLVRGPTVRRQINVQTPADVGMNFSVERFQGALGLSLEAWRIEGRPEKPTVLMFPGYAASKDTMLRSAQELNQLGHPLWMVDFHGIGGSEGSSTTIGYQEADDVVAAWKRATGESHGPMIGYGVSMGGVALLRAVATQRIEPAALIVEAPFDRLQTTLGNRLKPLHLPVGPLSAMLVFWGGVQHGFNGFAHNPVDYARSVRCPTLLLQGEEDENVGLTAFAAMSKSLGEHGTSVLIPDAGHSFLSKVQPEIWREAVKGFLAPLSVSAASQAAR